MFRPPLKQVKVFLEAGASIIARDESNKQPHEVAKNRRTLISFPRAQDPAEIQSSEVGAMSKDIVEYSESRRIQSYQRGLG